ncbi:hypothetical protein IW140_006592 [Coemansia sp. RSA 1813]|nr:hypothetical protein EV178_006553 [Coemansia sp. RSA 1646]KAJ1764020.1 hypothetical protein LPJ74_006726 [Coemansia sp. RSA 1843]KAJ2084898.1 hypothetical protein IW138_006550 [Coemansia sp. RSA 986]KAJ2210029.1 hypothetical protein EV179_006463 [Coemansia sp. RSA 487]KAJ2561258.1 hypothetical protein IW140_006592 [Coemansia sp. RSA 1813]
MARDFQCVIGNETKEQMKALAWRLPDTLVACVGNGSSVIGMFHPFIKNKSVRLVGAESACNGVDTSRHSWLKLTGRAEYHAVADAQAPEGFCSLAELEGSIPSLEASHAVYQAMQVASAMTSNELLVICISDNCGKDLNTITEVLPAIGPQIG